MFSSMFPIFLLNLVLLATTCGRVAALDGRHVFKRQIYNFTGPFVPSYNVSIPVDHFNKSDARTYNNRYWVNDTFYQKGGPVFYYDNGEQGVTDEIAAVVLAEHGGISAVMQLAKQYHGLAILFEHRYYGESLPIPFGVENGSSTNEPEGGPAGYQYLTVDQALEDVVYFAKNFRLKGVATDQLVPSKTPWIWLGGSYPGMRGAWIRIRNPEIFYAVWASSAPVQARYDGSPYFDPIERSLPTTCAADIRAVVTYADEIMSDVHGDNAYQALQRLAAASSRLTDTPFNETALQAAAVTLDTFGIANSIVTAIDDAYQLLGPRFVTDPFCKLMESYNPTAVAANSSETPEQEILSNPGNGVPPPNGMVAAYNSAIGLDAYMYANYHNNPVTNLLSNSPTIDLAPGIVADEASWAWQVATQIGWFQGSDVDNITYVSKYFNVSAVYVNRLNSAFTTFGASYFKSKPDTEQLNREFGGWNMQPSNVMFTDGEWDPWRSGGLMSQEVQVGAPVRKLVQDVPRCNHPPTGTDVFGLLYPEAVHVPDLIEADYEYPMNGTAPIQVGLALFQEALDAWLPCFGKTGWTQWSA